MDKIKDFAKTTLIGGLVVILPLIILFVVFRFAFNVVTNSIRPITDVFLGSLQISDFLADLLSLAVIIAICFIIGMIVETRLGGVIRNLVEKEVLERIPGYKTIQGTIKYFDTGKEERPFSSFALIRAYGTDTIRPGFVTEKHSDGSYTVVVPQWPVPTQGDIYNASGEDVIVLDISVEEGMKFVIGGGAGSSEEIDKYLIELKNRGKTK